jgi:hypothetical protein
MFQEIRSLGIRMWWKLRKLERRRDSLKTKTDARNQELLTSVEEEIRQFWADHIRHSYPDTYYGTESTTPPR